VQWGGAIVLVVFRSGGESCGGKRMPDVQRESNDEPRPLAPPARQPSDACLPYHVICRVCGYDLFGLPGRPYVGVPGMAALWWVTCPECSTRRKVEYGWRFFWPAHSHRRFAPVSRSGPGRRADDESRTAFWRALFFGGVVLLGLGLLFLLVCVVRSE
jgi:hypothetical protein